MKKQELADKSGTEKKGQVLRGRSAQRGSQAGGLKLDDHFQQISDERSPKHFISILTSPESSYPINAFQKLTIINYLHQSYGNRYVQSMIQAKLKIGQPNDKYEQEADRVEEEVMRMPEPFLKRQTEAEKAGRPVTQGESFSITKQMQAGIARQAEEGAPSLTTEAELTIFGLPLKHIPTKPLELVKPEIELHIPTVPLAFSEFREFPNISKRYTDWRAYKKKRDIVSKLRDVDDPALYIDNAISQWNSAPDLWDHEWIGFNNNFDDLSPGVNGINRAYLNLLRLYQKKGINNPMEYIKTCIEPIIFFNKEIWGHPDLTKVLEEAEVLLEDHGLHYNFAAAWAFMPHTINYNHNILSRHALGKAIDINRMDNPFITDDSDFLVIEKVTGVNLRKYPTLPFEVMARASEVFQKTFNDEWINKQYDIHVQYEKKYYLDPSVFYLRKGHPYFEQRKLILAISDRITFLKGYASRGFLNLDQPLVSALVDVCGLDWGGEWEHVKDFMHFQI